ncbi:fimbrial protein [Providencia alcalifaciens]|uniref:fimbrial protein n=1 Tax=Providencia alcalifaciens TaxID=126385 RepID=UPI003D99630D
MICKKQYGQAVLLGSLLVCSVASIAQENNQQLYPQASNWDEEGANGVLYVSGSLTESPCRLVMTSAYQSVVLGNTETAELNRVGQTGKSVPFHLELRDCIEMSTTLDNVRTGQTAWSSTQPAVKIRFIAPTEPLMPTIARVNGAQGIGLELRNALGQVLSLDETSNPRLLASGQDILTYYVAPIRTSATLQPGAYSAVIAFEMLYE